MKVLILHNHYRERGGEDEVVCAEKKMLEHYGHDTALFSSSNDEIQHYSFIQKSRFLLQESVWSSRYYKQVLELIVREKPDLAHIHNTFYLLSPSVYQACHEMNLPVIQTLHNYRFLCPIGTFYRDGKVCEECLDVGRSAAVKHKCWQDSYLASWALTRIIDRFEEKKIFFDYVTKAVALSEFCKKKYVEAGFPEDKITVKPNFADIPSVSDVRKERHVVFVGRLAEYKGISTLIHAFKMNPGIQLRMVGDGPMYQEIKKETRNISNIQLLGRLPYEQTLGELAKAAFLIFPSSCYETFGKAVVDAFGCGTPVVVSDGGAARELVEDGRTGLIFRTDDVNELSDKIAWMDRHRDRMKEMGANARKVYEDKYTQERNYQQLMKVYQEALAESKKG